MPSPPQTVGRDDSNLPRMTLAFDALLDVHFAARCALSHARDPEIGSISSALTCALSMLVLPDLIKDIDNIMERGLQDTPALDEWRRAVAWPPEPRESYSRWNISRHPQADRGTQAGRTP
jgi:hypothetical protein